MSNLEYFKKLIEELDQVKNASRSPSITGKNIEAQVTPPPQIGAPPPMSSEQMTATPPAVPQSSTGAPKKHPVNLNKEQEQLTSNPAYYIGQLYQRNRAENPNINVPAEEEMRELSDWFMKSFRDYVNLSDQAGNHGEVFPGIPRGPQTTQAITTRIIEDLAKNKGLKYFPPTVRKDHTQPTIPTTPKVAPLAQEPVSTKPLTSLPERSTETKVHQVNDGETLSGIAQSYGLHWKDLLSLNPQITDPDKIYVNEKINIPGTATRPGPTPVEQVPNKVPQIQQTTQPIQQTQATPRPATKTLVEEVGKTITQPVAPEKKEEAVSSLQENMKVVGKTGDLNAYVQHLQQFPGGGGPNDERPTLDPNQQPAHGYKILKSLDDGSGLKELIYSYYKNRANKNMQQLDADSQLVNSIQQPFLNAKMTKEVHLANVLRHLIDKQKEEVIRRGDTRPTGDYVDPGSYQKVKLNQ